MQDPGHSLRLSVWTAMLLAATLVASHVLPSEPPVALETSWLVAWTCGGIVLSRWTCPWHASGTISLVSWGVGALFGCVWWPVASPAQRGLLTGMLLLDVVLRVLASGFVLPSQPMGRSSAGIAEDDGSASGHEAAVALADHAVTPKLSPAEPLANEELPAGAAAAEDFDLAAQAGDEHLHLTGTLADDRAEQTMQWFLRRVEDDLEVCEGQLRVEFGAGVREVTLHVAFCPPLPTMPRVACDDVDGRGWQVQATAVYPYGIRLSVRRSGRELPEESGRVAYWAQASRQSRPAA